MSFIFIRCPALCDMSPFVIICRLTSKKPKPDNKTVKFLTFDIKVKDVRWSTVVCGFKIVATLLRVLMEL